VKLPNPCLMLVTDRHRAGRRPLLESISLAVAAGVDAVQLREKDLPDRECLALAIQVEALTHGRCPLLINSRLDVALIVGAQGVHLPEDAIPIAAARSVTPDGFLIGKSVHDRNAAIEAERMGADYIQLGTIFATESKPGLAPRGLDLLRQTTPALSIPCIAVGGIEAGNAAAAVLAGAQGIAAVSAILQAADVEQAVNDLRAAMTQRPGSAVASPGGGS
jgi:thiamine-phosphate pyrophosphorylase